MSHHAPHARQHAPTLPDVKSPALTLSSNGNIWSSSPSAQPAWSEQPDRWSQNRALGSRDPLQPSHNIPSVREEKGIGAVARGDLLKEYQRAKEDFAEQSRRPRVGAIGEGRAGPGKIQALSVSLDFNFPPSLRVICPPVGTSSTYNAKLLVVSP